MELIKLLAALAPEVVKLVSGIVKAIQAGDKKTAATLAREATERQILFAKGKAVLKGKAK